MRVWHFVLKLHSSVMRAGVDCVWTAHLMLPEQKSKMILGRSFWTAEAAARAWDRAQLAVHGRKEAELNFPSEWYGPEVHHKASHGVWNRFVVSPWL